MDPGRRILPPGPAQRIALSVENLWTNRASPVENLTAKIFLHQDPAKVRDETKLHGSFAIRFA
jgi:hypothetical protein